MKSLLLLTIAVTITGCSSVEVFRNYLLERPLIKIYRLDAPHTDELQAIGVGVDGKF